MTSRGRRLSDWFFVPALMIGWANLHGSFILGILLLGALFVGRVVDVSRRTGSLRALKNDSRTWRLLLLTQLAALAALFNPYGLQLYVEVLTFSSNPNLAMIQEWEPLTLRSGQGAAAFTVALVLVVLMRTSPRRVSTGEALLLIGLGGATLWTSRFLVWFAPVAALSLSLHGDAAWRRIRRRIWGKPSGGTPERRSMWSVASLGVLWIAFACTPFGNRVIHGDEPEFSRAVSMQTPIRATVHLQKHPHAGPIFNALEFGDYFVWNDVRNVFVTSHIHLVPAEVWEHYITILTAGDGWGDLLARYGVNCVALSPYDENQASLISQLRDSPEWRVELQDERSVVFGRKNPIPVAEYR